MVEVSPPRIALYGIGRFGQAVARLALDRGWEIAAAHNRSGPKVGRNLGDLLDDPRAAGIRVEDEAMMDPDQLASVADIAVVTVSDRLSLNRSAHYRLLAAGLNVACLGGESTFPAAIDRTSARELDELARSSGATFTGVSVWDAYRIWPLLSAAGACHAINSLQHRSLTLVDHFGPAAARAVGVGLTPTEHAQLDADRGPSLYRVFMHLVVHALDGPVDRITDYAEPLVSELDLWSAALEQEVPAGRVIGTRTTVDVNSKNGLTASAQLDTRLGEPGDRQHMSWRIDGEPHLEVSIQRDDSVLTTATCVVNRLPDIIAAPPGLVTVDQLGPMQFRSNP